MCRIGPNKLERERAALLMQIEEAFKGVSREGGVSWSESYVIDHYGTDEERAAARARDTESCWTELVEDPAWDPDFGVGGFSFLDPIGFRYYLPAAMVRSVRDGVGADSLESHLTLPRGNPDHRNWELNKWSLLDRKQRLAIKRFTRVMEELERSESDCHDGSGWREAHESYWCDI